VNRKKWIRRGADALLGVGVLGCLALVMSTSQSHAGTGGNEFADVWTTLNGWIQGTLGKIVTTAMVLVGIGAGIARQSLMAFAVGVGGGIGLYSAPTILTNIFTATVSVAGADGVLAHQPVFDLARVALALG
jgi:conjugal transfer pilus assembly protein TraA